ncbi:MAG: alpha/beta fold hydrolase, partial [Minicystis sp.]
AESEKLISGTGETPYDKEVQAALDELTTSIGVARSDVVLATAFTTASILDETLAYAARARSQPVPAQLEPWTVETPVMDPDKRVRFRGVYEAPEYRRPLPNGKWEIEGGLPKVQKKAGLEVFLSFADAGKSGPRPVVIFAHGLGGTKDGGWGTTERLAELGCAVFAIDSPEHGSRSDDPGNPVKGSFSFFGVDPATQSFDMGRARDNFRQMTSDQLELVRFISSLGTLDLLPVGAPDGVPDLDVSRVLYIGHSFGSVQGPAIFALAPEIRQAVWNVGGDGLTTLIRDSGTFSLLVNALRPPGTPDGAIGRFFAVTQAIIDPGDPLNYARFGARVAPPGVSGWTPRDMLLQEVIDDSIVPNSTSEALARAAGLTLMDPIRPISGLGTGSSPMTGNLPGGATGVTSQFDLIEGGMLAVHGELIFSPEARNQYLSFFKSGLASGHATAIGPYPKK